MAGHSHAKRLHRDVHDIFHHIFNSTSASLQAEEMPISVGQQNEPRYVSSGLCNDNRVFYSIQLTVCPHEGPYKGGHFLFCLNIPENYPFSGVEVWVATSTRPIWHPNIDLATGRVMLPLEWSPVLTLTSLALAIQMMLLEPSAENPLNLEACSYYTQSTTQFAEQVQRTLKGCLLGGLSFMPMHQVLCKCCTQQQHLLEGYNQQGYFVNRHSLTNSVEENVSHLSEEFGMILDTGSVGEEEKGTGSHNRKRRSSTMLEDSHESAMSTSNGSGNSSPLRKAKYHIIGASGGGAARGPGHHPLPTGAVVGSKRRGNPGESAFHSHDGYVDGDEEREGLPETSPAKRSRSNQGVGLGVDVGVGVSSAGLLLLPRQAVNGPPTLSYRTHDQSHPNTPISPHLPHGK